MDISMNHSTPFEWNVVTLMNTLMGNVGGVVNAISKQTETLDKIAAALDRAHPKSWKDHTVGQMLEGVGISGESRTPDGKYTMNPSFEFNYGLYGFGGVFRDAESKSWFALDVDPEVKAMSPDELRQLATLFRTSFAGVLDFAADEWEKQIAAGEVTLDDNNKEDEQ